MKSLPQSSYDHVPVLVAPAAAADFYRSMDCAGVRLDQHGCLLSNTRCVKEAVRRIRLLPLPADTPPTSG